MTTRIPAKEITGPYGALVKTFSKRMFGRVPESLGVMWHHVPALKASMSFGQKLQKWDQCDETLKSFAHMAVASYVGCSWCLDFNYFAAFNEGLDVDRAREIPRWRESDVFTPLEREVFEYAEAMSDTPPTVTDEMVAGLHDQLGPAAVVELTSVIGFANLTTRGNVALGIESEGFAAACDLQPLAARPGVASAGMSADPFVTHRSLLFTVAYEMLGSAADAEDVVQETWLRWAAVDQAEVRDPRAYLVRSVTRQSLNRLRTVQPPARGVCRRVAARAPAHQSGRGRRRRAGRGRVDRDAHRAGDARRRPSARCSCCARSSTSRTTRSRPPWTSRRRRSARWRTGPVSTWPRDGHACRSTAPSSSRWWNGSSPR